MGIIDNLKKQYENEPWLKCNNCGVAFKGNHECDYERLKQQNKVYKRALEFYADEDNNHNGIRFTVGEWDHLSPVIRDEGKTARQALEESE